MEITQNPFSVLVELSKIIAESDEPRHTLQRTVEFIAEQFNIDVCSIYVLEKDRTSVSLAATVGLAPDSVGRVRMDLSEGLTGLVLQQRSPVFVTRPSLHPRFKYFSESGEEIYQTFLGIPLIYQQELLGVLVVQTRTEDELGREQLELFQAIGSQISALVAYTGLLSSVAAPREETAGKGAADPVYSRLPREEDKGIIRGLPAAAGFGWGRAHFLEGNLGFDSVSAHAVDDPEAEIRRLERSVDQARENMESLARSLPDLAEGDRAIFQAQAGILEDPGFLGKIKEVIREGVNADYALKTVVGEYLQLLERAEDHYIRSRGKDVEDVGRMVLAYLLDAPAPSPEGVGEDGVIIASDVSPTELMEIKSRGLQALVLIRGGRTSHSVILARAFQIPTVIRAESILDVAREKDFLIVDGSSGMIFVNPSPEIAGEYERLREEQKALENELLPDAALPARTREGVEVTVGANISLLSDMELVRSYGADLVGLYRSEFPFLARNGFPTEEEQYRLYLSLAEQAEGRIVTIRTLDVGGDKFLPYLDAPPEDNPALGWRAIRISLEMEEVFRQQLRAILRASNHGPIRILFPMITAVSEIRRIKQVMDEEMQRLERKVEALKQRPELGIMLEVPGTVKILDKLFPWIDFVSIGTNDLIQYTLAVDRNNPQVEPLSSPFHPSVVRLLQEIYQECAAADVPVNICGEAASNPAFTYMLLAMGYRSVSVNPAAVPVIKDAVRRVSVSGAARELQLVQDMEEAQQIRDYLQSRLSRPKDSLGKTTDEPGEK